MTCARVDGFADRNQGSFTLDVDGNPTAPVRLSKSARHTPCCANMHGANRTIEQIIENYVCLEPALDVSVVRAEAGSYREAGAIDAVIVRRRRRSWAHRAPTWLPPALPELVPLAGLIVASLGFVAMCCAAIAGSRAAGLFALPLLCVGPIIFYAGVQQWDEYSTAQVRPERTVTLSRRGVQTRCGEEVVDLPAPEIELRVDQDVGRYAVKAVRHARARVILDALSSEEAESVRALAVALFEMGEPAPARAEASRAPVLG